MSMDLYLWKSPVVDDPDEAARLVDLYFEQNDLTAFDPSPDIAATADELIRLFPYRVVYGDVARALITKDPNHGYSDEQLDELCAAGVYEQDDDSPWADLPFDISDRVLVLSIRWSADDEALKEIERLAYEHDLVLYDPQGPDVHPPGEPIDHGPVPEPTRRDIVSAFLFVIPFAGATLALWWLVPWGWLRWPLVAIGAFITAAALAVPFAMMERDKNQDA